MIPGSRLRKLEAITGLVAAQDTATGAYTLALTDGQVLISYMRDERMACRDLREKNWRIVCNGVFERQQWKCAKCGERRPLSGHHKLFRSRWKRSDGPLDVESNTDGLCQQCHGKEH